MQQQGSPTVGDTITIVRHIVAPVGAVIDARAPTDSSIATLVSAPVLTREGDSVRISYSIAVWSAGHNDVVFPGAVIVDERGHVDTLADSHVSVDVSSVLPAKPTATIAPHAARPWLISADLSALPFAVLVPLALIAAALLQWRWRRRGPRPNEPVVQTVRRTAAHRLRGWVAAGESRLALEHLDAELRHSPAAADWRARAAAVRFADGDDPAVAALVDEGIGLTDPEPIPASEARR